jgi:hypothetical protein
VSFDYITLEQLRQGHPAWRLLSSPHAPMVASFLHRIFIAPNVRVMSQADLTERLEDELFALRQRVGTQAFPREALEYINDWADNDKRWLRKFYQTGSDEPHYDLTPATEKAIGWLGTLTERSFVGTESRLLTLFELLKQISEGSNADQDSRIAELSRRRDEISAEIVRVSAGDIPLLDDTAIKDRFQQFIALARELLTDFREVDHNFRALDRRVREQVALWEGGKGTLLEEIMGERDSIAESDQGKSFRAFWDFLMSARRQEELTAMLDRVLALPPIVALNPDRRTRRVHYDWLEAGEHTQRTVALLSQQLRRFLDDQAWLENRRIMDILQGIEAKALCLRGTAPTANFMEIADTVADIELPMERPLYSPAFKPQINDAFLNAGDDALNADVLFTQFVVDKAKLATQIRRSLQDRSQITLREICELYPLEKGLAELMAYLELAGESFPFLVDEAIADEIVLSHKPDRGTTRLKKAHLPRVIYLR